MDILDGLFELLKEHLRAIGKRNVFRSRVKSRLLVGLRKRVLPRAFEKLSKEIEMNGIGPMLPGFSKKFFSLGWVTQCIDVEAVGWSHIDVEQPSLMCIGLVEVGDLSGKLIGLVYQKASSVRGVCIDDDANAAAESFEWLAQRVGIVCGKGPQSRSHPRKAKVPKDVSFFVEHPREDGLLACLVGKDDITCDFPLGRAVKTRDADLVFDGFPQGKNGWVVRAGSLSFLELSTIDDLVRCRERLFDGCVRWLIAKCWVL